MSASFWETVAIYCEHLAPVAAPLMQATGQTARALHAAECETRDLERQIRYLDSIGPRTPLPESDT